MSVNVFVRSETHTTQHTTPSRKERKKGSKIRKIYMTIDVVAVAICIYSHSHILTTVSEFVCVFTYLCAIVPVYGWVSFTFRTIVSPRIIRFIWFSFISFFAFIWNLSLRLAHTYGSCFWCSWWMIPSLHLSFVETNKMHINNRIELTKNHPSNWKIALEFVWILYRFCEQRNTINRTYTYAQKLTHPNPEWVWQLNCHFIHEMHTHIETKLGILQNILYTCRIQYLGMHMYSRCNIWQLMTVVSIVCTCACICVCVK